MAIDWEKFELECEEQEKESEGERRKWLEELEGETPYEKVLTLRGRYLKEVRVGPRSKKWWDEKIEKMAKEVRKYGRGGKGPKAKKVKTEKYQKWRNAKATLNYMIKKKKEECWRNFVEEYGEKDAWEVARYAKDPFRLKGRMGKLVDERGMECRTEDEKLHTLVGRNFEWKEEDGNDMGEDER